MLQSGTGNFRTWIEIDNTIAPSPVIASKSTSAGEAAPAAGAYAAFNPVRAITADLYLASTRVQLDTDLVPLNIAKLVGRVEYKAQEGGYTVGSKALEIRTREGVVLPAADFSQIGRAHV